MMNERSMIHIYILAYLLIVTILNQMFLALIGFVALTGYLAWYIVEQKKENEHVKDRRT